MHDIRLEQEVLVDVHIAGLELDIGGGAELCRVGKMTLGQRGLMGFAKVRLGLRFLISGWFIHFSIQPISR